MLLLAQITTVSKPHDADMIRITSDEILPQTRPTENIDSFFFCLLGSLFGLVLPRFTLKAASVATSM